MTYGFGMTYGVKVCIKIVISDERQKVKGKRYRLLFSPFTFLLSPNSNPRYIRAKRN